MQTSIDDPTRPDPRALNPKRSSVLALRQQGMSRAPALAVALVLTALLSPFLVIGGDAYWMVAAARDGATTSVPYASAPSAGWHNVPMLAENLFRAAYAFAEDRGLYIGQLLCVYFGLLALAFLPESWCFRPRRTILALSALLVGAAPAFAVVRGQMFSLALFPALLLIIVSDSRSPGRKIWLLVPLVALWTNLHGAVLVGLATSLAYLAFSRVTRIRTESASLLVALPLSTLATPATWSTPLYFLHVMSNEAAQRHEGLWRGFTLSSPFDILALLCLGIVLGFRWKFGARLLLWEVVVLAALLVATFRAERNVPWLLDFGTALMLQASCADAILSEPSRRAIRGAMVTATSLLCAGVLAHPATAPEQRLVERAVEAAAGQPIVAEGDLGEAVAIAGGRVWLSNPLDAFAPADQRLFLDWQKAQPSADRALKCGPGGVLVRRGGPAERRMLELARYQLVDEDRRNAYYRLRDNS